MKENLKKECLFRHGDFKDFKLYQYIHECKGNKEGSNYRTIRIIIIQRCGFCGKLIVTNQWDQ
jgi:hypothetical protein